MCTTTVGPKETDFPSRHAHLPRGVFGDDPTAIGLTSGPEGTLDREELHQPGHGGQEARE